MGCEACEYTPHNPYSSVSNHPRHKPAAVWANTTRYCKYSRAPDDGRKHGSKHVELTWNNKLIYIVHLVGYFRNPIYMSYTTAVTWHSKSTFRRKFRGNDFVSSRDVYGLMNSIIKMVMEIVEWIAWKRVTGPETVQVFVSAHCFIVWMKGFRNVICIFRLELAHTACGKRHQCRVSVSYGFFTAYCSLIAGFRKPSSKFWRLVRLKSHPATCWL
jgi:hypothetical protein